MVNCVLVSQSFKLFEWSMTGQPVTNSQPYLQRLNHIRRRRSTEWMEATDSQTDGHFVSDSPLFAPSPFAFEGEREGGCRSFVSLLPSLSPVRSVRRFQIVRPSVRPSPSPARPPVQTAAVAAARRLFRSDQRPFADN